jgi:hypothetical protein
LLSWSVSFVLHIPGAFPIVLGLLVQKLMMNNIIALVSIVSKQKQKLKLKKKQRNN